MNEGDLLNKKYLIKEKLGNGGYGQVLKVFDLEKSIEVAMKIDINSKNSLAIESKILATLQGGIGIPKIFDTGKIGNKNFVTMQLLGPSTYSITKKKGALNLDTVILIISQAISRIEYVHSKGYIHRDIKPHQFLIGPNSTLFLVDFGISNKYITDNYHIAFKTGCHRIGSCSFASLNAHIGNRLSRRDDLESLLYTAVYLLTKSLPWMLPTKLEGFRKWNSVFEFKRNVTVEALFKGCPEQFIRFYKYVQSLKFEDKPDYGYLQQNIKSIRELHNLASSTLESMLLGFLKIKLNFDHGEENLRSAAARCIGSKNFSRKKRKAKTVYAKPSPENKIQLENLKIPIFRPSSCSGNDLYNSSKTITAFDETPKSKYPEFQNRKQIFAKLLKFKATLNNK